MSPSGIILSSGSQGATQEAIEKVLTENGFEPDKAEVEAPVEPKREDFDTDEAFEQAQEEHEVKVAEGAETEAEKQQRQDEERTQKKSRRQRAIDKATRDLQDENRKLNERLSALEGGKKPVAQPKIEIPKREDFQTDAQFEDAMFDYRYKVRRAKEENENLQKELTDRLKQNFENYRDQVAEFKEAHDDWDEVVNQSIPIHESVFLAVQEQENGAAVTYYLGKHPDYARKLATFSPLSAVMEVGRLAERLKTGARPPREAANGARSKTRTRIPEPVRPVSTSATTSTLTSAAAAQKKNYKAFKAAQRAGR